MAFKMKGFSGFIQKKKGKKTEATADPNVGKKVAQEGNIEVKNGKHIITYEDGSKADMSKVTRGGKTLLQHYRAGTL